MHKLYNTSTLQDTITVEADLKRPLAQFEDFLDRITDHINHYESFRSFNKQVANITKIQTLKESIKRLPQLDSIIATLEMDNNNILTRQFTAFTDYFISQFGKPPADVKPRGTILTMSKKVKRAKRKEKATRAKASPIKEKDRQWTFCL